MHGPPADERDDHGRARLITGQGAASTRPPPGGDRRGWPTRHPNAVALGLVLGLALLALGAVQLGGIDQAADRQAELRPWSEGRPGALLLHLNSDPLDVDEEAARRRVVVLNAWEEEQAADLRRENPDLVVLVYKDLASVRSGGGAAAGGEDEELLPTGVGYDEAEASDPSWFLTDDGGDRFEWSSYPGTWQMDVGSAAYQQRWLANVRAELEGSAWDGVFVDNALTTADAYHEGSASPAYPDDESMQAATRSMLAAIGPPLRDDGYLVMANVSASRLYPGLLEDWLPLVDGVLEEFWVNTSDERGRERMWDWGDGGWEDVIGELSAAEAADRFLAVRTPGHPDDREALLYGLGSYLLVNEGRSVFAFTETDAYSAEGSWDDEVAWDLGAALGPRSEIGDRIWRREFEAGVVVVNASEDETVRVDLEGTYLDPDDEHVDSVEVGPTEAAILRRS